MKRIRTSLLVTFFVASILSLEAVRIKKDPFVEFTKLKVSSAFQAPLFKYKIDTGSYPTTKEGLKALLENPGSDRWRGPYLRSAKDCLDPWGNELIYRFPSTRDLETFDLYSLGPDGKESTDDIYNEIKKQ